MRILKVTQAYYPFLEKGGPAVKVRAIAEGLARRGHSVTVLTVAHGGDASEAGTRMIGGVEVCYLRVLAGYRSATLNRGLRQFCRERLAGFDLVHIYGLYDLLGPVVARSCRRRGIPYVLEPMGMYRPIVRSLVKKRVYHWLLGSRLAGGARFVIATAPQEQRELEEEGVAASRILVRRNGVALEEFSVLPPRGAFRRELGIAGGTPLLLYLGRLAKKKGLPLLLEAFAECRAAGHLVIAGPDDGDGTLDDLHRRIDRLALRERVTIAGPRYGEQKLQAFADADAFVLPSQNENFGNAVAEAIACGVPVIVTDRCGVAPLVKERAGLVVPYDKEAVREGIMRLLAQEDLRQRFRAGCRELRAALSWDEPLDQMEQIYRDVVSERRV